MSAQTADIKMIQNEVLQGGTLCQRCAQGFRFPLGLTWFFLWLRRFVESSQVSGQRSPPLLLKPGLHLATDLQLPRLSVKKSCRNDQEDSRSKTIIDWSINRRWSKSEQVLIFSVRRVDCLRNRVISTPLEQAPISTPKLGKSSSIVASWSMFLQKLLFLAGGRSSQARRRVEVFAFAFLVLLSRSDRTDALEISWCTSVFCESDSDFGCKLQLAQVLSNMGSKIHEQVLVISTPWHNRLWTSDSNIHYVRILRLRRAHLSELLDKELQAELKKASSLPTVKHCIGMLWIRNIAL